MFVAGAVCPHPPLLIPETANGGDAEIAEARASCDDAIGLLLAAEPDVIACVGDGPHTARYGEGAAGSLSRFGVEAGGPDADLGAGASDLREPAERHAYTATVEQRLPLSLTVGAWLLDRGGWRGPRRYVGMARDLPSGDCVHLGRAAVGGPELRVGVLAMGDGTAKRSEQAPGYVDDRAQPLDRAVVDALARADAEWLAEHPDQRTCAELWVAGRQAWQFLAGAASVRTPADLTAKVHYDAAPYGVGYVVATWIADR